MAPGEASAGWSERGLASWYGGDDGFEGKPTASGEIYDSSKMTAAHRDLPLGTGAEVLEEPAARFAADLADALAGGDLTPAERSARAGLANRQVTIR